MKYLRLLAITWAICVPVNYLGFWAFDQLHASAFLTYPTMVTAMYGMGMMIARHYWHLDTLKARDRAQR